MNQAKQIITAIDWTKWLRNIALFATPLLILYLEALRNGVGQEQAMYLLYGATLQAFIDLLKKANQAKKLTA